MEICPKCTSAKIAQTMVLDKIDGGTRSLEIAVDEEPDAFIFKNRIKSYVFAHLCGDCGFLEFYAKNPQPIYDAFRKSKNKDKA